RKAQHGFTRMMRIRTDALGMSGEGLREREVQIKQTRANDKSNRRSLRQAQGRLFDCIIALIAETSLAARICSYDQQFGYSVLEKEIPAEFQIGENYDAFQNPVGGVLYCVYNVVCYSSEPPRRSHRLECGWSRDGEFW